MNFENSISEMRVHHEDDDYFHNFKINVLPEMFGHDDHATHS